MTTHPRGKMYPKEEYISSSVSFGIAGGEKRLRSDGLYFFENLMLKNTLFGFIFVFFCKCLLNMQQSG